METGHRKKCHSYVMIFLLHTPLKMAAGCMLFYIFSLHTKALKGIKLYRLSETNIRKP